MRKLQAPSQSDTSTASGSFATTAGTAESRQSSFPSRSKTCTSPTSTLPLKSAHPDARISITKPQGSLHGVLPQLAALSGRQIIYEERPLNTDDTNQAIYRAQRALTKEGKKAHKCITYLRIAIFEGDLAGFQIAWILISITFIVLKTFHISGVIDRIHWVAILVIPSFNCLLTGIFDGIIRHYQLRKVVESLRKSRFLILWSIKVIVAIYVTTRWIWGDDSFMARFSEKDDYSELFEYFPLRFSDSVTN